MLLARRWCPGVRPSAWTHSAADPTNAQTEGKRCCCTCGTCLCQVRPSVPPCCSTCILLRIILFLSCLVIYHLSCRQCAVLMVVTEWLHTRSHWSAKPVKISYQEKTILFLTGNFFLSGNNIKLLTFFLKNHTTHCGNLALIFVM